MNARAGGVARAREALLADSRFAVREVEPDAIAGAVKDAIRDGVRRILVCGGDGTIASAVGAAAETSLEIAVLPAGTLNHFARDIRLPIDAADALDLAATGVAAAVDIGRVNGRTILNTSSVGSYVDFVRHRDARKRWLGYRLASIVAAVEVWLGPRAVDVRLRADDGTRRRYHGPLFFVGVGERAVGRGGLGQRKPDGARALHILIVNERRRPRMAALVFWSLVRGIDDFLRADALDAHLVGEAVVGLRHAQTIAVDGELVLMEPPLNYALARDAVRIVRPQATVTAPE